ncbi:hypothetical protein Bca101_031430 [Brassica carinata]
MPQGDGDGDPESANKEKTIGEIGSDAHDVREQSREQVLQDTVARTAENRDAISYSSVLLEERTTQNDSVVMEGFSSKEVPETSGAVIMTKLMAELESISSGKNLSNITPSVNEAEQVRGNSIEKGTGERSGVNEWAIISGHSGAPALTPPGNNIETCLSPNGFQVLQDIREEGEIDEEDDDEDSESEVKSVEDCEKQTAPPSPSRTVTPLVTDSVENIPGTAPQRQSSVYRSREGV